MTLQDLQKRVLKAYPRAIAHLRRQVNDKRFGLILGAGISKNFKIPLWKALIKNIADDPKVSGSQVIKGHARQASFPYKTELLFQHFRKKQTKIRGVKELSREQENEIYADWLRICADHIYANSPKDFAKALDVHPYMMSLLPLIQGSHITVNFNFDDFLEHALSIKKRDHDKGNRGFETVTNPWPQFRRKNCVIYHPHGIFPEGLMELPTDRFVFSEAGYANKYIGQDGHDSSFLLIHFARHTCLIIGCSLEDSLRNVLIRSAYVNPGNYHYFVHFIRDPKKISDAEKRAIADTNFNVYNLITLFLSEEEIDAFLGLISPDGVSDADLKDLARRCSTSLNYYYYLTGPLGVGKSTTTSLLRNLFVLDEWLEKRPAVLGKPWDKLTKAEKVEADTWIINQFGAKNDTLRRELAPGAVAIVDRPPLDPLAFTEKRERSAKAKALLDRLCPDRQWGVVEGVIILLTGDCKELSIRLKATGRNEYTEAKLKKMQHDLSKIYQGDGVERIETCGLSVIEVTKKVAQIVHLGAYKPFQLTNTLKTFAGEKA